MVCSLQPAQSLAQDVPQFSAEQVEHFENNVVEILKANCLKCHAGAEPKGGLDLTSRGENRSGGRVRSGD